MLLWNLRFDILFEFDVMIWYVSINYEDNIYRNLISLTKISMLYAGHIVEPLFYRFKNV